MLRALTYLRYRRIVHGNIKASNVFRDPVTGLGILGDFRLPGIQSFDELAKPETSLHYMSPELLLSHGAQGRIVTVFLKKKKRFYERYLAINIFERSTLLRHNCRSYHLMSIFCNYVLNQKVSKTITLHVWLTPAEKASPKSDLWALAATICQLMTRLPPHSQMSRKELEV